MRIPKGYFLLFSLFLVCFSVVLLNSISYSAEIIFRPGPGLNDGTDDGSENKGKDATAWDCNGAHSGDYFSIYGSPRSTCNSCNVKAYIQFNIDSLPSNPTHVYLGVTHIPHDTYCYSNCNNDFYFYPVLETWDEMNIGTGAMPSEGSSVFGPLNITFPNDFGSKEYDITTIYNSWKNGTVSNNGLAIYSPGGTCNNASVIFYCYSSDENDSNRRPYLRIIYEDSPQYTITANAGGDGAGYVSSDAGGISYAYPSNNTGTTSLINQGTSVTVTATADSGSTSSFEGSCSSVGGVEAGSGSSTATCTFSSLDTNKTVSATFTLEPVNGKCGNSHMQTFVSVPLSDLCEDGTANPNPPVWNALNNRWEWNCLGLYMGTDENCYANIQQYTITTSANPASGGNVFCNPNPVNHLAASVCSITVNPAYSLYSVTGTCGGLLNGTTYTTNSIISDCSVQLNFVEQNKLFSCDVDNNGVNEIIKIDLSGNIYFLVGLTNWYKIPGTLSEIYCGDINFDYKTDFVGINKDGIVYYSLDSGKVWNKVTTAFNNHLSSVNLEGDLTWTLLQGTLQKAGLSDLNGNGSSDIYGLNSNGNIYVNYNYKDWQNITGTLKEIKAGNFNIPRNSNELVGLNNFGDIYYTSDLTNWVQIQGTLSMLATGDLNEDGQTDIIGIGGNGMVYYTTNLFNWQGTGGFLAFLTTGDLNGDKKQDIIGIDAANDVYYTTDLINWNNISGKAISLITGDFNGDGKTDVACIGLDGNIYYTTNLVSWTKVN